MSKTTATTLTITDIGPKGDGIAMYNDAPVYVERALPDDVVGAVIIRGKDGTVRASVEKIIEPSPFRITPECPLYDHCGGCSLQHANAFFYKGFKQDIVHRALKRVSLKPKYLDTVFCPPRARRRATFATFVQNDKVIMGYYKRRSHTITNIPDCLVVHPALLQWRDKLAPFLTAIIKDSRPTDVFLQRVGNDVEMVITGFVGRKGQPDLAVLEALANMVQQTGLARVGWRADAHDAPELLLEVRPLVAQFGKLSVALPLGAFLQPTQEGQDALASAVMAALPTSVTHGADLFSGCGTFTGPLLERSKNVDAFDISGIEALQKAAHKAGLRGVLNAQKRDLFARPLGREELKKYDTIVFDPPRAGAKEQAAQLAKSSAHTIVGISCNPATFARDARILCDGGYTLETVQIIDQFVWSHHVELVAKFVRT